VTDPTPSAEKPTTPAKAAEPTKPVERLFPFVIKSRVLILGRESMWHGRSKLHFVLLTLDISENSRKEILQDFAPYPVVQRYTSADLEKHFGVKGAKVVGFAKSGLAQSIYAELKQYRINKPLVKIKPPAETQDDGQRQQK